MRLRLDDKYVNIASLEASIAQQEAILAELKLRGEPAKLAEKFLPLLKQTLGAREEKARSQELPGRLLQSLSVILVD